MVNGGDFFSVIFTINTWIYFPSCTTHNESFTSFLNRLVYLKYKAHSLSNPGCGICFLAAIPCKFLDDEWGEMHACTMTRRSTFCHILLDHYHSTWKINEHCRNLIWFGFVAWPMNKKRCGSGSLVAGMLVYLMYHMVLPGNATRDASVQTINLFLGGAFDTTKIWAGRKVAATQWVAVNGIQELLVAKNFNNYTWSFGAWCSCKIHCIDKPSHCMVNTENCDQSRVISDDKSPCTIIE